jgi:hypothetical protein
MEILGILLKALGLLSMAAAVVCAGFTFIFSDLRSLGSGAGKGIRPAAFAIVSGFGALGVMLFWIGRSL